MIRASRPVLLLVAILGPFLAAACQSAMSVEEAKKVAATFNEDSLAASPRADADVTEILGQEKPDDPSALAAARNRADESPPDTIDAAALGTFFFRRGMAAGAAGRLQQQIRDLTQAERYLATVDAGSKDHLNAVFQLALAEAWDAKRSTATKRLEKAIGQVRSDNRGILFRMNNELVLWYAFDGYQEAAERALARLKAVQGESWRWPNQKSAWVADRDGQVAIATGRVLELKGQFAEAEKAYRQAVAILTADETTAKEGRLDYALSQLAVVLAQQGKLVEAEVEARRALIASLRRRGRTNPFSGERAQDLAQILFEQGRYSEAEALAREAQAMKEAGGTRGNQGGRRILIRALVAQERWGDALVEYDRIARGRWPLDEVTRRFLTDTDATMALIKTQRFTEAVGMLETAVSENRTRLGESHPITAVSRGLLGAAYAARGDREAARQEFAAATPILLNREMDTDDGGGATARDRRRAFILTAYIELLADPGQRQMFTGFDPADEAFRLAEVVRSQAVNRALQAGALRASAKNVALADLVRREQDAGRYIATLYARLADLLAAPPADRDENLLAGVRTRIDSLQRARQAMTTQVARDFPAYAELTAPAPGTVAQSRATLRPGEALISTLVTSERTFVWAIPQHGPVMVTAAPIGVSDLATAVGRVRAGVDLGARTLGDIPEFDVAAAYGIYRLLLKPVQPAWDGATTLIVVPHGPLGQLPFSLLPTKPVALEAENGALFSRYRSVPWLTRTHAVTVLPAAGSLATLRALPPGDPTRLPFIGFGDPFFSKDQARRAAASEIRAAREPGLSSRGMPITLRRTPMRGVDASQLAMLPRLPETADEIRSIALAMSADVTRDVFVGLQANEKTVRTMDLSKYRIIAFATHGLVAGDLDGLTQPALALTAPDVANVEGNGLLTVDKILGLRLNADWVVLSACNTASGQGAGSEAISGLGRAFFYAGARSLLVSNWPVETTSAKKLTTDLFRRQAAKPRQSRAQALQDTINALIDSGTYVDPQTKQIVFSYAHPIFWAPFTLVGDGGGTER